MLSPTGIGSQRLQGFTLDGGIAPWFLNEPALEGVIGSSCAITVEHASKRSGIPELSYEQIAA